MQVRAPLRSLGSFCFLLPWLAACASAPRAAPQAPPPAPEEAAPSGKLPRDVRPLAYGLGLEIVPSRERFSGHARIRVELTRARTRIWLHAKGLRVSEASAKLASGEVAATFAQVNEDGLARLDFASALPAGQALLDLSYDAAFDRQLDGLYKVEAGGNDYAFTQFEAVSARQAFPCFDEPVFKTPFDVALTIPAEQVAISNTPEQKSELVANGMKLVRFATTRPLPTYLVAFIVGPLDVVQAPAIAGNDVRKAPLPLRGVAIKGKGQRLAYALEHAPALLTELERYFGVAYPYPKLDLIAVPDFAAGAMENAGAITFREWLLMLDPKSAPESQRRAYANVVAHEMAHHWTGDYVTMPWWDDIWLNEAFATFMATKVVSAVNPDYHADVAQLEHVIAVMDADSRASARKIRQPIESTHDIANAFDGLTYQKGAGVLEMFERYLGVETFRRGVQTHLRMHGDGVAEAKDFFAALGEAAGRDVAGPMSSFLDQVGVPLIEAELHCDQTGAVLQLKQSRYLPAGSQAPRVGRFYVPVCASYEVHGQTRESCSLLIEPEGSMKLEVGCPDWVMPNAEGAGYYRWSLAAQDLGKLRAAGFKKLSAREKLSFADSLRAGFENGSQPAERVLGTLPVFAGDAERSVATAPTELLRFTRQYMLDEAQRGPLDAFGRELYEPRLRKLGWKEQADENGDQKLLRAEIVGFLANTLRDKPTRATAAQLGRRYLGLEGKHAAEAVPADLQGVAALVAVQEGNQADWDAVYKRFVAAEDPAERDRLLAALSAVTDARSGKALGLSLDPALHVNEVMLPLRYQLGDERTREAAWSFFEQNFDALVARVSKEHAGWMPGLAVPFCTTAMADRVQTFFAPRIAQLVGGPRSLASAVESLRLCAAQVELQRASAQAFFAARK